jgi:hypothetical protein
MLGVNAKSSESQKSAALETGQSGNHNGRPMAPRFTARDQHAVLTALAGAFGEGTQRAAITAMQAVLSNPRTVLKALELCARLNGELDSPRRMSRLKRPGTQGSVASGHASYGAGVNGRR